MDSNVEDNVAPTAPEIKDNAKTATDNVADPTTSNLQEGYSCCEYCSFIGRSESFFSKSKRFCSCVCSRSYSSSKRDKSNHSHNSKSFDKKRLLLAKNIKKNSGMISRENSFVTRSETANKSFEWGPYLDKENSIAAPVCCFKHCYSNDFWQSVIINMKVEILNLDTNYTEDKAYWFATIKHVAGYFVKVRFEGYDDDGSNDLWVHLCSEAVNPVGWCAMNGKRIIPPLSIEFKYNWREYLLNALTGTFTLPYDFRQRVIDCNKSWPLVPGLQVEVVNKMCLSSTKVATIEENKGGRLKLRYNDSEGIDSYFWCHCLSSLIHPVGWSSLVGHNIEASAEYKAASLSKATFNQYHLKDATPSMFSKMAEKCRLTNQQALSSPRTPPPPISPPPSGVVAAQLFSHLASRQHLQQSRFHPGMKLEAVDPLNLGSICAATVDKVLKFDKIMVSIDGAADTSSTSTTQTTTKLYNSSSHINSQQQQQLQNNSFCFDAKSPYILPVGFCKINNIELTPPRGHKLPFDWYDYLQETRSVAAPVELFNQTVPKHGYRVGMKVEAVDLMDPKLICVATITMIVGRLMKIHFDGWEVVYDQWVDCQSPDIYPIGWCQLFNHRLEAPRMFGDASGDLTYNGMANIGNKKTNRSHLFRGGRKRKRMKQQSSASGDVITGYATTISAANLTNRIVGDDDDDDDNECGGGGGGNVYGRNLKRASTKPSIMGKQDHMNAGFFSESSPVYSPCEESDLDLDLQKQADDDDLNKSFTFDKGNDKNSNNNNTKNNNSSNIGDGKSSSSSKLLYTSIKNSLSFKSDSSSNVSVKSDFSNADLKKTVDEKLLNDHLKVISS